MELLSVETQKLLRVENQNYLKAYFCCVQKNWIVKLLFCFSIISAALISSPSDVFQ